MAKQKPTDPEGRHIRVYVSLLNSPAYRVLSYPAKALFVDMRSQVTGLNNGNISAALSEMKHKGWVSPSTLAKALYELRAMGLLAITRAGGLKQGTRVCNLYRFTDLDVYAQPKVGVEAVKATHDYRQFDSAGEAKRALRTGVKALQDEGKKNQVEKKKAPVRKMYPIGTDNVALGRFIATDNEQGSPSSVRNMNREISV